MEMRDKHQLISVIRPASTWEQPLVIQRAELKSKNESESSLMVLNDDCLIEIFKYCDTSSWANLWKVCQRTRDLLEEFVMQNVTEYEIGFHEGRPKKSLKRVHDELVCFNPYIKKLRLTEDADFMQEYNCDPNAHYPVNLNRYLSECSKYLGSSIKQLQICQMPRSLMQGGNLVSIQPLLNEVESLEFIVNLERHIPERFEALKLKELSFNISQGSATGLMNVDFLHNAFPHLEKMTSKISMDHFMLKSFLRQNVQLKFLKIRTDGYTPQKLFKTICDVSENLEELIISHDGFHPVVEQEYTTSERHRLSKLLFNFCDYLDYYECKTYILLDLQKLKTLQSIVLTGLSTIRYSRRQSPLDAIVRLGRELKHLEYFCIDLPLDCSTITEFIRNAPNLKRFCTEQHASVRPISDFMKILAEIRKSLIGGRSDEIAVLDIILYPSAEEPTDENVIIYSSPLK